MHPKTHGAGTGNRLLSCNPAPSLWQLVPEPLHRNADGSPHSWHAGSRAGEFNCERRGSVLLHWSSRTTNTKSTSKHLRHQHSREGGVSHDAVKDNKSKMLFIYLSDARSTSASNALQIIGRSVQLPRKCILVWGKAEQDNKFCSSRKSQELTNVFLWKWRKKSKGNAFVAELKLAEITLVCVESAIA